MRFAVYCDVYDFAWTRLFSILAEGRGFEPLEAYTPTDFKSAAIDHSASPPFNVVHYSRRSRECLVKNCRGLSPLRYCPYRARINLGYAGRAFTGLADSVRFQPLFARVTAKRKPGCRLQVYTLHPYGRVAVVPDAAQTIVPQAVENLRLEAAQKIQAGWGYKSHSGQLVINAEKKPFAAGVVFKPLLKFTYPAAGFDTSDKAGKPGARQPE